MSFATDMTTRLGGLLDYDPDRVGLALCQACENMFGGLDVIVQDSDDGPGWSAVLDPDRAPASWLPWTGALYGVQVTIGAPEPDQREEVRELPAQHRGTTLAMVKALKRTLGGNRNVRVTERYTGAYRIKFLTSPSETLDAVKSLAAIKTQKPGGLALFYEVTDSSVWNETTLRWNEVADGVTWNNAEIGEV